MRSLTTNHFFDSGNVIFDENILYHALHKVSSTPIDHSPLPFAITAPDAITPATDHPTLDDKADVTTPLPTSDNDPSSQGTPVPPPVTSSHDVSAPSPVTSS